MQLNKIPFSNTQVTVYNQYSVIDEYGKTQTRWTSYVFENGLFKKTQQTKIDDKVILEGDFYVAQVPNDTDYLPFIEWIKLVDQETIDTKFTVQEGDVVVKGNFEIDIPVNSSPIIELKKIHKNIGSIMFTAKTAQANISDELAHTSHFYWAG